MTTLLDSALRRVRPATSVTPEADTVRGPELVLAGDDLGLVYFDSAGKDPGVFSRLLDREGRIAGPAHRLSESVRGELDPALCRAPDGGFWAAWTQEIDGGTRDVVARRLDDKLAPAAAAVRLTAFAPAQGTTVAASALDVAVAHGHLYVTYAFERNTDYAVMLERVPLSDPQLVSGLEPQKGKTKKGQDRAIGTLKRVSQSGGKNAEPRIACAAVGCWVAWDDEKTGALLSFVEKERGDPIWRREFAKNGSRPAVAAVPDAGVVAWFESSRVRMAHATRDGLEESSVIGKVSGYQPQPAIAPGTAPGQWYISWRDYESGHLEAFAVRAECK